MDLCGDLLKDRGDFVGAMDLGMAGLDGSDHLAGEDGEASLGDSLPGGEGADGEGQPVMGDLLPGRGEDEWYAGLAGENEVGPSRGEDTLLAGTVMGPGDGWPAFLAGEDGGRGADGWPAF